MNQDIQILKYLATVDKSIGRLYEKLIKELAKVGATIDDFASGAFFSFKDYPQVKERVEKILDDYSQALEAKITNGMTEAINMSYLANTTFLKDYSKLSDKALKTQRETATKSFIQSRTKSSYGLGLSDKVWNYTQQAKAEFEAGMSELIEDGITEGISAEDLGRKLSSKLNNPDMVYRRYHLKKLTATGKKDVVEWRKKVVDEEGKVYFIKTEMDLVGRGVYRSSRKNALRLAATEINMAYRYADSVRWQSEPFIRGIRIRLSGNHTLNGKPFTDICDDLAGDYPKAFMWSGWHPRCYSDDSEVLTSEGWKLFKDVTLFDGILSLNPNNKEVEFVSIVSLCKWYNNDVMVRIYGSGIDYLVTKDHEILIENNGKIGRIKASSFDCSANSLFDCSCDLRKDIIEYHGYVYDLELESNHIMYIRRNGKCFWGSNCRCSASPILIPQEEMDKIYNLPEDEYQNYRPKDLITEMPDKFKSWFEQNKDKIEASIEIGTQPYFIRDNKSIMDNLFNPKNRTPEQEQKLIDFWNEKKKRTAFLRGRADNVMRVYEERFGFDVPGLSLFENAIKNGDLNDIDLYTVKFAKNISKVQRNVRANALNQIEMAKNVPEVDYSELEKLLKGNNIGLIRTGRMELEQRMFDMMDAEDALSDLFDNVRELHTKFGIIELQQAHTELSGVMSKWLSKYGYSSIDSAPLAHLKNKLLFEISSPTYSYSNSSLIKQVLNDKLVIVNQKIEWNELVQRADSLKLFKTKSSVYKSLISDIDDAISSNDFSALKQSIAAAEVQQQKIMASQIKRDSTGGALNKEYKGSAIGKDIHESIDVSTMVSEDPYRGTFTNNIARMQGFDSPAKLVSPSEFEALAKANGDVFYRTLNPATFNGKQMSGQEFANQIYLADKLEMNGPGGRVYGDGMYVASSAWDGSKLHPVSDALKQDAYYESACYGHGEHGTLEMTWLRKPRLIKQSELKEMWYKLSKEEKMKYGGLSYSDYANTYACALGYDGMYCTGVNYIVIFNRSIIAVNNKKI